MTTPAVIRANVRLRGTEEVWPVAIHRQTQAVKIQDVVYTRSEWEQVRAMGPAAARAVQRTRQALDGDLEVTEEVMEAMERDNAERPQGRG